jgi:ABC-type branched-subunit amino acid transport system ATPase component
MLFSLPIPTGKSNAPLNLGVNVGEMLFILGANGTGKSSLMQAFASRIPGKPVELPLTDRRGLTQDRRT